MAVPAACRVQPNIDRPPYSSGLSVFAFFAPRKTASPIRLITAPPTSIIIASCRTMKSCTRESVKSPMAANTVSAKAEPAPVSTPVSLPLPRVFCSTRISTGPAGTAAQIPTMKALNISIAIFSQR